jgi:hypothetical protein
MRDSGHRTFSGAALTLLKSNRLPSLNVCGKPCEPQYRSMRIVRTD